MALAVAELRTLGLTPWILKYYIIHAHTSQIFGFMELMKYVDTMEESPLSRNISHSAVYKGPGSRVSVAERGPPTATMETPASLRKRPSSSPLTAEAH